MLRAAGTTRTQVNAIVIVEGLLFGLIGVAVGIVVGTGIDVIHIVVSSGSAFLLLIIACSFNWRNRSGWNTMDNKSQM